MSVNKFRLLGTFTLLTIGLSTARLSAQNAVDTFQGHEAVASEALIKFRSAPANDPLDQAKVAASVEQAKLLGDIDVAEGVGSVGWLRFHSRSEDVSTLMGLLSNLPDVLYVEPNYIIHLTAIPNDPSFSLEWGLRNTGQTIQGVPGVPGADIGAVSAWDISTGTPTIVVGVVDTGIDYNHPDLAANVWTAPSQFTFMQGTSLILCPAGSHGWNVLNNTCDPLDDNDHGTHVSGTIGAAGNNGQGVTGVNWNTKIIACKFLDTNGNGNNAGAVNCLQFMEGAKASFGGKDGSADIRVLNNSWGNLPFSQALLDEINVTNGADMLFVAAAGNNGTNNDTSPFYPASYNAPNVVAVAAFDNRDQLWAGSDFGASSVHLGAPGVSIFSTLRNGMFGFLDGTSMATAHVSGTAALSLSVCEFDDFDLKPNLLNNVVVTPALSGKTLTGGRVNAFKALRAGSGACPGTGWGSVFGILKTKRDTQNCDAVNGQFVCPTITDSGTVSLTVNGVTKTVSYGVGSTAETVAKDLANAINADSAHPARTRLSGSKASLSAKRTGADTCYTLSSSVTFDDFDFSSASFSVSLSGSTLAGCR